MKKQKFKYNPETLSYDKVQVTWRERILKALIFIAPAIVLGVVFSFLFSALFPSPAERKLVRENENLRNNMTVLQEDVMLMTKVMTDLEKRDNEIYRVVFNAEPFPDELRELGTGGVDEYEQYKGYEASDLIISTSRKIKELQKRIYAQSVSFDEVIKLAKEKEQMLASIPAIQPVSNKDLTRIASGYGWRIDPIYKTKKMHWGIDFTADTGTEVYATGNGVVVDCETKSWGYGKSVIIDHGYGYITRYAHLSEFKCKKGDRVTRGQLIGLVGSTGKSTGPHLHYEVEKNGVKINPIHFFHSDILPEEYERMIEMAGNANQAFD